MGCTQAKTKTLTKTQLQRYVQETVDESTSATSCDRTNVWSDNGTNVLRAESVSSMPRLSAIRSPIHCGMSGQLHAIRRTWLRSIKALS
mgnify:CR=1 FL=1